MQAWRRTDIIATGMVCVLVTVGIMMTLIGRRELPHAEPLRLELDLPAKVRPATHPRATDARYLGVILARQTVDLAPRLDGRLLEVRVRLGDAVSRGDLIATLDVSSLRFDLAIAQAALREVHVEQEKAGIELTAAGEHLDRRRRLAESSLATGEEMGTARHQRELADARLAATQARVSEQKARLEQIQQSIANAEIRAPFAGVVAARYADPGANVTRATPVVRLISANELFVRFAVPENVAQHLVVGARVEVAASSGALHGTIEKVSPELDAATRMVHVEAGLERVGAVQGHYLSGETVRVALAP